MFIPLRKVDAAQRLVYGQIDETPDRSGEVFDYASSKPHFVAWSDAVNKATDGKSLGNIRAMHGNVAAGKLESISFDDVAKSIEICARIVDDAEWAKVDQGVYTGFSPGGRYLKRWPDAGLTRYTAQPAEISIVDLPCIPSASFTMIKADGVAEERPWAAETLAKAGARNSKADKERLQAIHDHAVGLGACCGGEAEKAAGGDLAKMAGDLSKLQGDLAIAEAGLAKALSERNSMAARVAELEARPEPGKGVLKVVHKSADRPLSADDLSGGPDTGTFDERLCAIEKMAPGEDKASALRKLAADFSSDTRN